MGRLRAGDGVPRRLVPCRREVHIIVESSLEVSKRSMIAPALTDPMATDPESHIQLYVKVIYAL
jgi:hypothetical protein